VNGKPWPKLAVEQRTYRLHWLDAAISREFSVKFIAETEDGLSQVTRHYTIEHTIHIRIHTCHSVVLLVVSVSTF
jgi:hypothetical protein